MYNYETLLPGEMPGGGSFVSDSTAGQVAYDRAVQQTGTQTAPAPSLTATEMAEIIGRAIGSLRVYVVESDITEAQNRVRAVVEESLF